MKSTLTFHGAFISKNKARVKEKKVGGFILQRKVRGKKRYVVAKKRKR